MGDMPATTPADLDVPGVEVHLDVTDRDHDGERPVVDLPDVALDVDLDDPAGDGRDDGTLEVL